MKTQFDDSLKQLNEDIIWNEDRKREIQKKLEADYGRIHSKMNVKKKLTYVSSIAVCLLFFFIAVSLIASNENQQSVQEPSPTEVIASDSKSEETEEAVLEEENQFPVDATEDEVKMTEDRTTWTEEEMENDIAAGITLTHRQLAKLAEGTWVIDFDSEADHRVFQELFLYIGQASTAAFHLRADNWLYVDLINLNSVMGEALRKQDPEGFLLAYQVVHDLDVAYNGYESTEDSYGVTLYRDATNDVVRTYLGRK